MNWVLEHMGSPIANVQTSGNLITAHGHFLSENGVFYIVH